MRVLQLIHRIRLDGSACDGQRNHEPRIAATVRAGVRHRSSEIGKHARGLPAQRLAFIIQLLYQPIRRAPEDGGGGDKAATCHGPAFFGGETVAQPAS